MSSYTPTIVVVDDSPAVRRFFKGSMAPLDVNVLVFATAEESLAYLNDSFSRRSNPGGISSFSGRDPTAPRRKNAFQVR